MAPSPVVALNRAVAVAEVAGPVAGLDILDGLDLPRSHLCGDRTRRQRARTGVPAWSSR
jgi:predicted RNA polymerase sigma factor